MASRFGPSGESRYRERDRSPPQRFERRGSNQHGPPSSLRSTDNSYRPSDSATTSNFRDVPGAPRGPRESGRGGSFAPRGRGYGGRSDLRDTRDSQYSRRESERDFSRRDFDRRSPPAGRNRSRTPPTRDFRDSRDMPPRSLDMNRVSRDSRDSGPLSATSASSDGPLSAGGFYRGSNFRGRGRGEWDSRGRGRGTYVDDRDNLRARSRSRDRRSREYREEHRRDRDRDSLYGDDDKLDRESDHFRREPSGRPESRNSGGSQTDPSTPLANAAPAIAPITDRFKDNKMISDSSRRSSFAQVYSRPELPRSTSTPQPPSSPMQCPQVPAFGSYQPATNQQAAKPLATQINPQEERHSPTVFKGDADPTKLAPKGPKADFARADTSNVQPSMALKGFQRRSPYLTSPGRGYDVSFEGQNVQGPSSSRFGTAMSSPSSQPPSGPARARSFPTWSSPEIASRSIVPGPSASTQVFQASDSGSRGSPGGSDISSGLSGTGVKIPTEPKAVREKRMSSGTRAHASNKGLSALTWTNPQVPTRPSILSPLKANLIKRDDDIGSKSSMTPSARDIRPSSRASAVTDSDLSDRKPLIDSQSEISKSVKSPVEVPSAIQGLRSAGLPEDDDAAAEEDEDGPELDQEDFDEQESEFNKNVKVLQSRLMPPPPENPKILSKLEYIDILASAIEDLKDGKVPPPAPTMEAEKPKVERTTISAIMPTPPSDPVVIKQVGPNTESNVPLEEILPDLSLDGLPYLASAYPTPKSFDFPEEDLDDDRLCQYIQENLVFEKDVDEKLRQEFKDLYREWREYVDALQEEKACLEGEETRAATPLSSVAPEPSATPTPSAEPGRRSARGFATQYDLEQTMETSRAEARADPTNLQLQQAAQNAQEKADYTREAVIPDMLTTEDQKIYSFEDTNNRITTGSDAKSMEHSSVDPALLVFGYIPPKDNFTEDEQEIFKEAFVIQPKRWGHIARDINLRMMERAMEKSESEVFKQRDFHNCILHYYLTKKGAIPPYKSLQSKKTKGRKKRGVARARALLSSAIGADDAPVRMTDTGRPKRAAAPSSFADKEKKETEVLAQKRRTGASSSTIIKPMSVTSEANPEKTPAKRGRGANKDKSTKRGPKAAALAPNISPSKKGPEVEPPPILDIKIQDTTPNGLEDAQLLADFHNYSSAPQQSPPAQTIFPQAPQPIDEWQIDLRAIGPGHPIQITPSIIPQQTLIQTVSDQVHTQRAPITIAQQQPQPSVQVHQQMSPQPPPLDAQSGAQPTLHLAHQPQSGALLQGPSAAQPVAPQSKQTQSNRSANLTSSYWSVQESQLFEELIRHHGRDWLAISKEMPAKTETMVKNNFTRLVQQHHKKALEEAADEADRYKLIHGPPGPLDPSRSANANPNISGSGRRRGPTVSATQRILAPNPEQIPDLPLSTPSSVEVQNGNATAQASPQERSHPRLAPQRQILNPTAHAMPQNIPIEQAVPSTRFSGQTQQLLRPAQPQLLQAQSQAQQITAPSYQHHIQSSLSTSELSRDGPSTAGQPLNVKRPRSISEQDRSEREQPSKRQVLSLEDFTNATATQHEQQQQQQQRAMFRTDSQQSYDYRPTRQQPSIMPQPPTSLLSNRSVSNPEDVERANRHILQQNSPRELRRDSFGTPRFGQPSLPSSVQSSIQPNIRTASTQYASQARASMVSPAQHTPPDVSRPASVSVPAQAPPAPRPSAPAQAKRSNLMDLLNDERTEEPRKPVTESKPAPPLAPPRHASPMSSTSMYQNPNQIGSYPRRELVVDPIRDVHQSASSRPSYAQQSYGSPAPQTLTYSSQGPPTQSYSSQQNQHQVSLQSQSQQSSTKEPSWPSSSRAFYADPPRQPEPPRHNDGLLHTYQPTQAPMPNSQAPYLQPARPSYTTQPQHIDPPSHTRPAPSPSHSRASSYSLHPNSQPGAGQALARSPYADIRPSPHSQQLQAHAPPPHSPQHPGLYHPGIAGASSLQPQQRSASAFGAHLSSHEPLRRGQEDPLLGRRYTPTQTPPAQGYYPPPPA